MKVKHFLYLGILVVVACSSPPPARAPGSNPGDMSPAGHEAAADAEEQRAAEHRDMPVNPNTKAPQQADERRMHEKEAEKHDDFANQHREAADKASDGGVK